jgi:Transglycosylase SLT domain
MPRKPKRRLPLLRHLRLGARRARQKLAQTPLTIRIAVIVAILLPLLALTNVAYHVILKPTELFAFIGHRLDKEPPETWRSYAPLFRAYSTSTITPELLAALAQTESSGNPVDRTYWRWRWSFNPFAIYQPASSAVGLYQMIDGAFDEAARFCIRDHAVVETGCGFKSFYIRVLPSHSIELASVYLDQHVAGVLTRTGNEKASASQKQDLAAFIHLCGAGPASAFARRHFQMMAGERCGDHLVAAYVARVDAFKRQFQKLAAEDGE